MITEQLTIAQTYFYNEDAFNFNYGQCMGMLEKWKDAEEALLLVQADAIKRDYVYLSWLCRSCACYCLGF